MAQYFIGNFHNTIKFLNSSGFSLEGYENIDAFIQVLNLISKAFFAPTIGFFYITTTASKASSSTGLTMYMTSYAFTKSPPPLDFGSPLMWEQKKYI
jgi:hypothetical protein